MSYNPSIVVSSISKCYEMYTNPKDRLKQIFSRSGKKYYNEFWALKDVSFELQKGETVGILGRNGSGKSTLLQIITGTLQPSLGHVQTNGIVAALLELGSGFNPEFSGRENIYLNGSILGISREKMERKLPEIIEFADIGEHLEQPVKTYSSGMAVRLAFAVQACIEPEILIVDEALAVGDEKFQRKCYDYIERLRLNGCSILLVTHSTATIEKFCQRAILLHKGVVHGIGQTKDIIDQYHALLYSDESTYLRFLNQSNSSEYGKLESYSEDKVIQQEHINDSCPSELKVVSAAYIRDFSIKDLSGQVKEFFYTGNRVFFDVFFEVLTPIDEIQVGILIRTVEGVSVFGTSTMYHKKNITKAQPGEKYRVTFNIKVDLCPGTYFVTFAIAEKLLNLEMSYLDRRTDALIFKVVQPELKSSGIASLDTEVTINS